jgi:hypothetical protein
MHLCLMQYCGMLQLTDGAGIGDEQVADSAPMVRALVVARLELMWRTCEPHIAGSVGRPDPRFIEAGIRVVDRLMRIYRLDAPGPAVEDPDAVTGVSGQGRLREVVAAGLEELEARIRADADDS